MATWKQFFSGVTLDRTVDVELDLQWWDKPVKKPSKLVYGIAQVPLEVIEGSIKQGDFKGDFSGSQCTSMCLQAICHWKIVADGGSLTKKDMDISCRGGHGLHEYLRIDLKVSDDPDMRVGIEDLPDMCHVKSGRFYNRRNWQEYLSLPVEGGAVLGLRSLRDYLISCMGEPFGVLVTIGIFTQAVMFTKEGHWLVYDSHGKIKFMDKKVRKASCWVFDNVDAVIAFLVNVRRNCCYCLAAKPFVLNDNLFAQPKRDSIFQAMKKKFKRFTGMFRIRRSATSPGKVEASAVDDDGDNHGGDDDGSYVSLMGGWGE